MDGEALGDVGVGLADAGQGLRRDRGGDRGADTGIGLLGHGAFEIGHRGGIGRDDRDRGRLGRVGFGEDALQAFLVVAQQLLGFFLGDVTAADQ